MSVQKAVNGPEVSLTAVKTVSTMPVGVQAKRGTIGPTKQPKGCPSMKKTLVEQELLQPPEFETDAVIRLVPCWKKKLVSVTVPVVGGPFAATKLV